MTSPISTPQDPWGFGGLIYAGGMAVFDPAGNGGLGTFGYQMGGGLGTLTTQVVAPGVRGWKILLTVAVQPGLASAQIISTSFAFAEFAPRIVVDVSGAFPGYVILYIVDGTGTPVDPSTVSAAAPADFFAIQFFSFLAPGRGEVVPGPP